MATREQIVAVLTSDKFTDGEKFVVKAQIGQVSNFTAKLWDLLCASDDDNLARLAVSFPDQVAGFLAWNRGDLGKRLRAAGCPL